MRSLFAEFRDMTHWPSWLRGFSAAMIAYALFNHDIIYGILSIILYGISMTLQHYFPYAKK